MRTKRAKCQVSGVRCACSLVLAALVLVLCSPAWGQNPAGSFGSGTTAASTAEVAAGTSRSKYVSPYTLANGGVTVGITTLQATNAAKKVLVDSLTSGTNVLKGFTNSANRVMVTNSAVNSTAFDATLDLSVFGNLAVFPKCNVKGDGSGVDPAGLFTFAYWPNGADQGNPTISLFAGHLSDYLAAQGAVDSAGLHDKYWLSYNLNAQSWTRGPLLNFYGDGYAQLMCKNDNPCLIVWNNCGMSLDGPGQVNHPNYDQSTLVAAQSAGPGAFCFSARNTITSRFGDILAPLGSGLFGVHVVAGGIFTGNGIGLTNLDVAALVPGNGGTMDTNTIYVSGADSLGFADANGKYTWVGTGGWLAYRNANNYGMYQGFEGGNNLVVVTNASGTKVIDQCGGDPFISPPLGPTATMWPDTDAGNQTWGTYGNCDGPLAMLATFGTNAVDVVASGVVSGSRGLIVSQVARDLSWTNHIPLSDATHTNWWLGSTNGIPLLVATNFHNVPSGQAFFIKVLVP